MNIYLDNAAATMVRKEAIGVMTRVMADDYGNPSSMHSFGRHAKELLDNVRANVAAALGAKPCDIFFTSGGTEANNLAILGIMKNRSLTHDRRHIITSAIEHSSVLNVIKRLESEGFEVTYLSPDSAGRIPADAFAAALRGDTVFASVMLVNNETGAVNPAGDYAAEIKRRGFSTILHTDAVQGLCKIPFTVKTLGIDLLSVSAHKLHGPKGAGALYVRNKLRLSPLLLGGEQENSLRPGTEALPVIAGFGEAVRLGMAEREITADRQRMLRNLTLELLKTDVPDSVVIGEGDSPYILCISLPGYKSEVLMNFLDGEGICVSNGAACRKGARSHTLTAMGLPKNIIDGVLRVSFSRYSTFDEVKYFVNTLKKATETLVR